MFFFVLQDIMSSDVIIMSLARALAVFYVYLQFSKLRNLGSKYILGKMSVCLFKETHVQ